MQVRGVALGLFPRGGKGLEGARRRGRKEDGEKHGGALGMRGTKMK
jgi:hypothetical protein